MTISSAGYDGQMLEKGWADLFGNVTPRFGVAGVNDFKVVRDTTRERGVTIAAGVGWNHGVIDTNDEPILRQHDVVAAGTRWDLIVKRTNWQNVNGGPTTIEVIKNAVLNSKTLPTMENRPGVVVDQALGLVEVRAGQFQVGDVIDLRSWSAGGVQIAANAMFRDLPGFKIGTHVEIAGVQWLRKATGWVKFGEVARLPLLGVGGALAGGAAPDVAEFGYVMQTGTAVGKFDGNGYTRLTFPRPFPGGVVSVLITSGDISISEQGVARGPVEWGIAGNPFGVTIEAPVTRTSFIYNALGRRQPDGAPLRYPNMTHRINWLAIGW